MRKVGLLRAIRDTSKFRKGQKLWVVFNTGALAALVTTRWKGKGRWIRTWAHTIDQQEAKRTGRPDAGFFCRADARWVGEVPVSAEFAAFLEQVRYRRRYRGRRRALSRAVKSVAPKSTGDNPANVGLTTSVVGQAERLK